MNISTSRLRLRPVTEDDTDGFHALQSNAIVARFTQQGSNNTRRHSEEQLDDLLALVDTSSETELTIILAVTVQPQNELVGLVGTFRPREIGFSLHPDFHGQGYAQEAVRGFCHWYLSRNPTQQLFAKVNTESAASLSCMARCGFHMASEEEVSADEAFRKDSTRETWLLQANDT